MQFIVSPRCYSDLDLKQPSLGNMPPDLWFATRGASVSASELYAATLPGNLLYPLGRTGPVVPAHSGDDQERVQAEREFLEDALCPAWPVAMLLRARRS